MVSRWPFDTNRRLSGEAIGATWGHIGAHCGSCWVAFGCFRVPRTLFWLTFSAMGFNLGHNWIPVGPKTLIWATFCVNLVQIRFHSYKKCVDRTVPIFWRTAPIYIIQYMLKCTFVYEVMPSPPKKYMLGPLSWSDDLTRPPMPLSTYFGVRSNARI